ncbi:hypothetical protein [Nocardia jiangsuensis]|uniref:Uncharacterized protein n=1 Tax=Nocardia jiangsuensis TaxID=1691563 RepID=A0ABV8E1A9_9NOCA
MTDLYTGHPAFDRVAGEVPELAAVAERHRELLRDAVDAYRLRIGQWVRYLDPEDRALRLAQAERQLAELHIDPVRHADLDLDAYRAVRDGVPMRYVSEHGAFVRPRNAGPPVLVRPGSPEHRLGVVARLAALGQTLEQIQVVAVTATVGVPPVR